MPYLDPFLLASRWTCGDLLPDDIVQTAVELIEAGYGEPSVYRLTAEDNVYSRDQVEILVQRMFSALGVPYPMSQEDARQTVTRQIAREVTAGLKESQGLDILQSRMPIRVLQGQFGGDSASSLVQILPHIIGFDLALQLSICQIDTQALPVPFDRQASSALTTISSKRFAMRRVEIPIWRRSDATRE